MFTTVQKGCTLAIFLCVKKDGDDRCQWLISLLIVNFDDYGNERKNQIGG